MGAAVARCLKYDIRGQVDYDDNTTGLTSGGEDIRPQDQKVEVFGYHV